MEVRPGYKLTEVGTVPWEWDVRPFEELARIERGKFTARPRNDPKYYGGDIPFIQTGDVTNASGRITTYSQTLNSEGLKVSRLFPRGTLFFTIAANIGDVGVADFDTACPDSLVAITPTKNTDKTWLSYELAKRKASFESIATHNAQLNINLEKLRPYLLPVPPFPEQLAIATALSDVDALLSGLDRLIAKKRDLKQAAMQQLLTGQTRLPGFHGEWEVKPFAAVLVRLNAKAYQIQTSDYQATGKYPVVDQGKEPVVGFSDREEKCLQCPDGGVIVFGDHTCFVKFIDFDFLVGADGTQILQSKAGQSTRFHALQLQYRGVEPTGYNRHFKFLKERDFVVPPLPEQVAIAAVLSDMDAELSTLEARRNKTRDLKQAMMQELLTGRTRLV
jgi:type I restriction enzyme S subunit